MRTYDIINAGPKNRFTANGRVVSNSGAIVQLQNLYRNSLPDLAQARELVKLGDYEALNALYDSVPEVLAECVRTAFIPQKGMKFIVADFSAIEARVVAYIAGEDWKINAFREGKDIYCETASKMFHKTVVKHGENGELRQLGKVCELACIAFNSLVLTDKGLVPIQNVTKNMKLWDGEEWVSHDGVIYKGEREIITYDGLTATKDHLVYVDGQSNPTRFDIAATSGAHLVQTGDGRRTIRLGKNNQSRETMEQKLESLLCFNPMSRLRFSSMAAFRQFKKRKVKRMPILFKTEANSFMARPKTNCCQTTMYESQGRRIQKLRCKRDKVCFFKRNRSWSLLNSKFRITRQKDGDRPHRYKWRLCSWQYSVCRPQNKLCKSAQKCFKSIRAKILALCIQRSNEKIISRFDKRRNYRRSKERSISEAKKLENYTRTSKVYDILNAGKHHRFTVSGKLVHNCGYSGSVKALEAFGALENGMHKEDLQPLVNMWRTANSKIVRLWYDVDKAAKEAIKEKTIRKIHDLTFTYKGGMMYITLPSGRRLSYVKPQIGKNKFGSESIEYMGLNIAKQWSKLETFGGKLVENITQAISRDILCHAMFMLKDYRICAHVHDEIVRPERALLKAVIGTAA